MRGANIHRTAWLRRVPPATAVALASAGVASGLLVAGIVLGRRDGSIWGVEAVVALVAVAAALFAPIRFGHWLGLAVLVAFGVLELADDRLGDGIDAAELLLAVALLGSVLGASYIRHAIARRDSELALAADAIAELTRRDRITEHLSGGRELTWLETELERARRHHHQLALVLIRPDRFGELTALGGTAAVEVLESVAEVVGHELRATDYAFRHQASTFALLLPETTSEGARVAAERIRLFLPLRTRGIDGREITVSLGVATFPEDAATNDELVRLAERALERAEERGGNRTVVTSGEAAPPGWTLAGI